MTTPSPPSPGSSEHRRKIWANLESMTDTLQFLSTLKSLGPNLDDALRVETGQTRSNLSRLLELAERISTDPTRPEELELALDVIHACLSGRDGAESNDSGKKDAARSGEGAGAMRWVLRATIRPVIRLTIISSLRRKQSNAENQGDQIAVTNPTLRTLTYPPSLARPVLQALLEISSEIIDGRIVFESAKALAGAYTPYLAEDDPLVRVWRTTYTGHTQSETYGGDEDGVSDSLTALTRALDAQNPTTGATTLSTTSSTPSTKAGVNLPPISPQDLLSLLAPNLLRTLQTAPEPPLGIKSTLAGGSAEMSNSKSRTSASAAAYAGKVYGGHEFRMREGGMPSGLGAGAGAGNGVAGLAESGGGSMSRQGSAGVSGSMGGGDIRMARHQHQASFVGHDARYLYGHPAHGQPLQNTYGPGSGSGPRYTGQQHAPAHGQTPQYWYPGSSQVQPTHGQGGPPSHPGYISPAALEKYPLIYKMGPHGVVKRTFEGCKGDGYVFEHPKTDAQYQGYLERLGRMGYGPLSTRRDRHPPEEEAEAAAGTASGMALMSPSLSSSGSQTGLGVSRPASRHVDEWSR